MLITTSLLVRSSFSSARFNNLRSLIAPSQYSKIRNEEGLSTLDMHCRRIKINGGGFVPFVFLKITMGTDVIERVI